MNLYDSISNPIEDNGILKEIIKLYRISENQEDGLYDKLTASKDSREFNAEKYKRDYEELIVQPTMKELYKNIRTRIGLNENVFGKNSSILEKVFKECSTYEKFKEKVEESFNENQKNVLKKCFWITTTPKELFNQDNLTYDQQGWYEDAKEYFSDEEIYSFAPYIQLEKRMYDHLKVSDDVMGFHINAEKKMDLNRQNEKNELKFYINAGDDTCKVAALFRDKCEKAKMNYYFKVINPYKDRMDRADRLCIYSEKKHMQDFFNILQEIKKENPQIEFEQPPMMVGKFNDWLGIACDYSGGEYAATSYNVAMSYICRKALNKIFEENKKRGIKENDIQDTELIELLKEEIAIEAQKMGYLKERSSIKPSVVSKLKKIDTSNTKKKHKTGNRQMQNVISSVQKANIRVSEIKNIMENIKESISRRLSKYKSQARLEESKSKLNNIPTEQIELKRDER